MENYLPSPPENYRSYIFLCIEKVLFKGKRHCVLLGSKDCKLYAIKFFNYCDKYFSQEILFTKLSHTNIVAPLFSGTTSKNDIFFSLIYYDYCKYGDFFEILYTKNIQLSEKMIRTYYRQLLEAVEYLHSNKIIHHDIKLENIFLDEMFRLRLGDFDTSHIEGTEPLIPEGTKNYAAPEQYSKSPFDSYKAEYFTLGVVLFTMFTGGRAFPYPHTQYETYRYYLENKPDQYWGYFKKLLNWPEERWSEEFKELFMNLTCQDAKMRYNLDDIKKSAWYQGEVCSQGEIYKIMTDCMSSAIISEDQS